MSHRSVAPRGTAARVHRCETSTQEKERTNGGNIVELTVSIYVMGLSIDDVLWPLIVVLVLCNIQTSGLCELLRCNLRD